MTADDPLIGLNDKPVEKAVSQPRFTRHELDCLTHKIIEQTKWNKYFLYNVCHEHAATFSREHYENWVHPPLPIE